MYVPNLLEPPKLYKSYYK